MSERQRNNNIFIGIMLIFLAIYILASRLGNLPKIPIVNLCFIAIFGYTFYRGIKRRKFDIIFIPGALLIWQVQKLLDISFIGLGTLIIVSVLLTFGFRFLFDKNKTDIVFSNDGNRITGPVSEYNIDEEYGKVKIENGLGSTVRYIRDVEISDVEIDNGLGSATVYFENCVLKNGIANVSIDNGMGSCKLFCPKEWSVNLTQDNGLGSVSVTGNPSTDPQAPCFNVHVDNGMGSVNIDFN